MVRSKGYNEEILGLEAGLKQLLKNREDSNIRRNSHNLNILIDIQKARIESFNSGYNLAKKEMKEQRLLVKKDCSNGFKWDSHTILKAIQYLNNHGFEITHLNLKENTINNKNDIRN